MKGWLLGGPLADSGALEWSASPSVAVGLAVVVALLWGLAAVTGGRGSRGLRALELACLAVALTVLAAALCGPEWVSEAGAPLPGRTVILVDRSASMGVAESDGTRGERAVEIAEELRLAAIAGGSEVEIFGFDGELHSGMPDRFDGRESDIGAALAAVSDRNLGRSLRAVAVISDGIDRGALRAGSAAPASAGPVTFYAVGSAAPPGDVEVEDVGVGSFAFLRTPFSIDAVVRGQPGDVLPVSLHREGRLVRTVDAQLDGEGRGTATFEVTPRKVGRFAWEVSVPTASDDPVPGNNTWPAVVRVVRDRTRVLQVCGSPSYDQKFLRLFLKGDPSVDLVSFFILRTHEDRAANWGRDELSLIEFPTRQLFTGDLASFDLVILQNFESEPYFTYENDELLTNIADYVREGGALLTTGGNLSYDLAGYGSSPLRDVLAVELGVAGALVDEAPFRPRLTEGGRSHPVTRLAGEISENPRMWAGLSDLDGLNLTTGLAPGAAALLEHPTLRVANGSAAPVLAVREVGQGRSMALTIDSSWRWSFTEAAEGRGNQAYLRFWKNSLRWLVADPDERRVVVSPSRENVLLGDVVDLRVKVRDPSYAPVPGATVRLRVSEPGGDESEHEVVTGPDGDAVVAYTASRRGAHRVSVRAGGDAPDRASTVFAVSTRDPELSRIGADADLLRRLAEDYGESGRFFDVGEAGPVLSDLDAEREVVRRTRRPLGGTPLVALLFGLFGSVAWGARRRSGGR